MTADMDPQQRKLQILCLHGSRQDGEVFSQRLRTLRKKLSSIADLHFVSAPHTLPLQEGQAVPMRAWWRHWNIAPAQQIEEQQQQHQQQQRGLEDQAPQDAQGLADHIPQQQQGLAGQAPQQQKVSAAQALHPQGLADHTPQQQQGLADQGLVQEGLTDQALQQQGLADQLQQQQHQQQQQHTLQQQPSLPHGKDRDLEVHAMMAAGWEAVVLNDWAVSLQAGYLEKITSKCVCTERLPRMSDIQHLCDTWQAGPPRLTHNTVSSSSSSSLSSLGSSVNSSISISTTAARKGSNATEPNSSSRIVADTTGPAPTAAAAAAAAAAAGSSDLEYDGVLGFSNGAAAAFLFAAHAAANPEQFRSLRFVALAGGYVPEPLDKLLPAHLLHNAQSNRKSNLSNSSSSDTSIGSGNKLDNNSRSNGESSNTQSNSQNNMLNDSEVPPALRLAAKLPYASLHMMGSNDPLMDVADSSQLMECFQEHGRVQLVHDSGHAVPQQSRWMQEIIKFVAQFAEIPLPVGHKHHHKPHKLQKAASPAAAAAAEGASASQRAPSLRKPAAAAAAAAAVDAGTAEIEAKLHRLGLRKEGVMKGPVHKHPLIKVDSTGQPHQHVDITSPKAHHSHTMQQQWQQQEGQQQQQPVQQQQGQQQPSAAGAAAEFGDATDIQLEEIEALQAIYGSEFYLISTNPPSFTIKLREPSEAAGDSSGGEDDSGATTGPPSRLFTLRCKLPKDYPNSEQALPVTEVEGPLGKNDPARAALMQHIHTAAVEQQQEMRGAGGYVWQLANAAKEWIDSNLPANVGDRRAGEGILVQGMTNLSVAGDNARQCAAMHDNAVGSMRMHDGSSSSSSNDVHWWEKEDIDVHLIEKATAEAAAAHWRSWAVSEEDNPFGDQDSAAAAAGSGGVAAAAALGGYDGARGRWDYTIGLVGKPSAGKSTFFNAVVDPVREEDAAREAPFPFTTITPNIGQGFIVLPDPAPLLGFSPDQTQPSYGHALGFNINNIQDSGFSNVGPLLQLVRDTGWQQGLAAAGSSGSSSSSSGGDGVLWRKVPVVVKDVAGLVPGAYKGRGRGNAFLNDLCDADVLIHVVDVSGTTDSEGQGAAPGEGADPTQEIRCVRHELHCWVYNNIRAKWPTVLRRPNRLPGLFTGYHAPTGLVTAVLRAVGVRVEDLAAEVAAAGNAGLQGGTKESSSTIGSSSSSSLASWGEWELHRLVAHFLAARFPILLALNKADLPSAEENIRAVLAARPHDAAVAVSAASERKLQHMRRAELITYLDAAATAGLSSSSSNAEIATAFQEISQTVLQRYGSTGVLAALTCAVALKPPRWVFPIADRETCAALPAVTSRATAVGGGGGSHSSSSHHSSKSSSSSSRGHSGGTVSSALGWGIDAKARAAQGSSAGVLRDCILLKPGSRVEDVYQVLKRPPYGLLEGDFVRAECRVLQAQHGPNHQSGLSHDSEAPAGQHGRVQCRVVRKDELVGPSNCVLLLQTNRKVSWQGGAAGKRHQ